MDLRKLFGISTAKATDISELGKLFSGIESIVSSSDEGEIKRITSVAGLLGKVAYADMNISEVEQQHIRQVLETHLHLSSQAAHKILKLLGEHRAQLYSIEDFIYLRMVNTLFDKEEKLRLLSTLFTIAAADNSVSAAEDAVLWSIAKGLKLSHREFVSVRAEFKDQLDVLKSQDQH